MRTYLKQTFVEWGFITLLAVLCVILSALQYHWTGEVSRGETQRLRAGLNDQAQQFGRTFDSTLRESRHALVPQDIPTNDQRRVTGQEEKFQKMEVVEPPADFQPCHCRRANG